MIFLLSDILNSANVIEYDNSFDYVNKFEISFSSADKKVSDFHEKPNTMFDILSLVSIKSF